MVDISFGSPDSGDFKSQLLISSDWISSEMEDLLTSVLFNPTDYPPLWDFTLRHSQISVSPHSASL
jgi:hypothetical protein